MRNVVSTSSVGLQYGTTPLHHAAGKKNLDIAKLLMKEGANVKAVDKVNVVLWVFDP
jgi:hypothetical protein